MYWPLWDVSRGGKESQHKMTTTYSIGHTEEPGMMMMMMMMGGVRGALPPPPQACRVGKYMYGDAHSMHDDTCAAVTCCCYCCMFFLNKRVGGE